MSKPVGSETADGPPLSPSPRPQTPSLGLESVETLRQAGFTENRLLPLASSWTTSCRLNVTCILGFIISMGSLRLSLPEPRCLHKSTWTLRIALKPRCSPHPHLLPSSPALNHLSAQEGSHLVKSFAQHHSCCIIYVGLSYLHLLDLPHSTLH